MDNYTEVREFRLSRQYWRSKRTTAIMADEPLHRFIESFSAEDERHDQYRVHVFYEKRFECDGQEVEVVDEEAGIYRIKKTGMKIKRTT